MIHSILPDLMKPIAFFTMLALGTAVVSAAELKATSEFTTTDPKKVKILEDSSREKDPEGDSFMHQCPGLGGYKVIHEGGDLRSWINLIYGGKKTDLMQDSLMSCPGQFPAKANDTVEWRGYNKGDKFVPYAIIYRMMSSADDEKHTRLETFVVVKLDGADSRVIGHVPAKEGVEKAEAIADNSMRSAEVTCEKGDIYLKPAGGPAVRLTESGRDSDPCLSHSGKQVVFVRDTPGVTISTGSGDCNATELLLMDVATRKTEVLAKGKTDDDMKKLLAGMSAPCFSLDDKAVYFNSAAWAVSNSVQKVIVASKEIRFITDGDSIMVVPSGKHAGCLLICRELIKNDKHGESMGRGSYLWMYSPEGKDGKEVKSTEGYTAEDYLKDQGIRP